MADKQKDKPNSKPSPPSTDTKQADTSNEPHLLLPSTSTTNQSSTQSSTQSSPTPSPTDSNSNLLWQKPASPTPSPSPSPSPSSALSTSNTNTSTPSESKPSLLTHASQFLSHPSISTSQNTQSKRSFLESKGLSADEINSILNTSTNQSPTGNTALSSTQPTSSEAAAAVAATAPIITYPEFALSRPPPILSRTALLNIAYGTAALATGIVVGSKYILHPMLSQLTEARGEMYRYYAGRVGELSERLEGVVSVLPSPAVDSGASEGRDEKELREKNEGEEGDPSELFHRDIATQTSPSPLSPSPSPSASPSPNSSSTTAHTARLASLTRSLSSLHATTLSASTHESTALDRVLELSRSLDEMLYMRYAPSMYGGTSYGAAGGGYAAYAAKAAGGAYPGYGAKTSTNANAGAGAKGSVGGAAQGQAQGQSAGGNVGAGVSVDEVNAMKSEIRSFKGLLLAARNFPRGTAA